MQIFNSTKIPCKTFQDQALREALVRMRRKVQEQRYLRVQSIIQTSTFSSNKSNPRHFHRRFVRAQVVQNSVANSTARCIL